jgi:hypothetical protein
MRSADEELSSPAAAAALNDELHDQPESSSSDDHAKVDHDKCEQELKEGKDDSPTIFGADVIFVNLESSLIHCMRSRI